MGYLLVSWLLVVLLLAVLLLLPRIVVLLRDLRLMCSWLAWDFWIASALLSPLTVALMLEVLAGEEPRTVAVLVVAVPLDTPCGCECDVPK